MGQLGRMLIVAGAVLAVLGLALVLVGDRGLPLGRLPGDFVWKRKGATIYFPLASSILISVVLTLLAKIFFRGR